MPRIDRSSTSGTADQGANVTPERSPARRPSRSLARRGSGLIQALSCFGGNRHPSTPASPPLHTFREWNVRLGTLRDPEWNNSLPFKQFVEWLRTNASISSPRRMQQLDEVVQEFCEQPTFRSTLMQHFTEACSPFGNRLSPSDIVRLVKHHSAYGFAIASKIDRGALRGTSAHTSVRERAQRILEEASKAVEQGTLSQSDALNTAKIVLQREPLFEAYCRTVAPETLEVREKYDTMLEHAWNGLDPYIARTPTADDSAPHPPINGNPVALMNRIKDDREAELATEMNKLARAFVGAAHMLRPH